MHAILWGHSFPKPRGGEMERSNVTTSKCLIRPLQQREKMGNVTKLEAIIILLWSYLALRQSTLHYNSSTMCKNYQRQLSFKYFIIKRAPIKNLILAYYRSWLKSRVMGMYLLNLPSSSSTTTSIQWYEHLQICLWIYV